MKKSVGITVNGRMAAKGALEIHNNELSETVSNGY